MTVAASTVGFLYKSSNYVTAALVLSGPNGGSCVIDRILLLVISCQPRPM